MKHAKMELIGKQMDEFISDLAKKNKNEFSVNQYHIFRDKQFKIGLEKNYYKDTNKNYTEFDRRLGAALKVDWEYADGGEVKKGSEWAFWAGLLGLGVLGYFGINKK